MSDTPTSPPPEASALVIEVPEAEPLVGDWRRAHDPVSRYGMPAHVTVLYPFVEPHSIGPDTLAQLLDAIGDHPPFTVRFRSTATFPSGVVYLVPEPADPFIALVRSLMAVFPEHPPYGGEFAEPIPHLTVANGLSAEERGPLVEAIEAGLGETGITSDITAVSLFTRGADGRWVHRAAIPLGTDASLA